MKKRFKIYILHYKIYIYDGRKNACSTKVDIYSIAQHS